MPRGGRSISPRWHKASQRRLPRIENTGVFPSKEESLPLAYDLAPDLAQEEALRVKSKLAVLLFLALFPAFILAQQATRGGDASLRVGATASLYRPDYISTGVGGPGVFVDFDVNRRWGLEGAARWLRFHDDVDLHEDHYQIGPRVNFLTKGKFHPYAKGFVGVGKFTFPTNAGSVTGYGGYLMYGGGAGLDYRLNRKWTVRAVDFEYQHWPEFTTGAINPYGVNVGLSYRVF